MSGALLALQSTQPGSGPAPPAGTVLYSISTPGVWSYTSEVAASVIVEGWAGGGPGSAGIFDPLYEIIPGTGGGGGAYFKKTVSVTIGQILSGLLGAGGNSTGPTSGAPTTFTSGSCTANGGTYARLGGIGLGGTATGGDTNTPGSNGSGSTGGGAGNGGGPAPALHAGTSPGGGGGGGSPPVLLPGQGAPGQVKITISGAAPFNDGIELENATGLILLESGAGYIQLET